MIWTFTCNTKDCENQINPVNLIGVSNPVLCSVCHEFSDAVETDEPAPTPQEESL